MAKVPGQTMAQLAAAPEHETEHDVVRQALGGFLDKIISRQGDGGRRLGEFGRC